MTRKLAAVAAAGSMAVVFAPAGSMAVVFVPHTSEELACAADVSALPDAATGIDQYLVVR
jgi:hypothetical protein